MLLDAQLTATLPALVAGTETLAGAGGGVTRCTVTLATLLHALHPVTLQACTR